MIYSLTVKEIAQAQKDDAVLKKLHWYDKYSTQLVKYTQLICKNGKIVIPTVLQNWAVIAVSPLLAASWTHPSWRDATCSDVLERYETYYLITCQKNCHTCQVNEQHKHKYGKLPAKLVIANPWEALLVDLIGHTLSKVKMGEKLTLCVLLWLTQLLVDLK